MIVTVYALLAGAFALLRLLLGGALVLIGCSIWRHWRKPLSAEQRTLVEDRSYLLFLQAFVLAGLSIVCWPLLYLVLQSYVPEWPGVMCIYGVTRIGTGSEGAGHYLPTLLALLQTLKPALVFLTGVWLVLYNIHRRSQTGWMLRSIVGTLILIGCVSILDASAEIAYLVIPKKNELLSSGCCLFLDAFAAAIADHATNAARHASAWLIPSYFVANLAVILGLRQYALRNLHRKPLWASASLLGLASVNAWISFTFVKEVIAPRALGMPDHHCLYDLIPHAPTVVLALTLLAWGSMSVGWTIVAAQYTRNPETTGFLGDMIGRLARRGVIAYSVSMALIVCAFAGGRG